MPQFDPALVRMRLEAARKSLIDISLRNKLINYRPSKTSGVTITESEPAQVLRLLVANRAMRFKGRADQRSLGDDQLTDIKDYGDAESLRILREGAEAELDDFLEYPDLARDQIDLTLRSNDTDAVLANRLLRTWRDANVVMEEQGINVLFLALGMLTWYEADSSEEPRNAPLLFVPVQLERGRDHSFRLRYDGTEVGANLSLAAKLAEFNVVLPEVEGDGEDLDVSLYFAEVDKVIRKQDRWAVDRRSAVLGLFSYAKYMMYKDLDGTAWDEDEKPWNQGLLGAILDCGFAEDDSLPTEETFLDPLRPVRAINEVCEADSSQVLAILEANSGRSMVIEGPPGTGKSQTITNLIAEAIGNGKKVLFVAEKMAALEVVARRLEEAELQDACLELHSHKTNKKAFYGELKRTLALGAPRLVDLDVRLEQLDEARTKLNEYSEALHTTIPGRGLTPYEAIGAQITLGTEQSTEGRIPFEEMSGWSKRDFEMKRPLVERLQEFSQVHGLQEANPFFGAGINLFMPEDRLELSENIDNAITKLAGLLESSRSLATRLCLSEAVRLSEVRTLGSCASRVCEAPSLLGVAVTTALWNEERVQLVEIVEGGKKRSEIRSRLDQVLRPEAWAVDVDRPLDDLQRLGRRWFRFILPAYYSASAVANSVFRAEARRPIEQKIAVLQDIREEQRIRKLLEDSDSLCRGTFGVQWEGIESDWSALEQLLTWVLNLHAGIAGGELPAGLLGFFDGSHNKAGVAEDAAQVNGLLSACTDLFERIAKLLNFTSPWPPELERLGEMLRCWRGNMEELAVLVQFNHIKTEAVSAGLATPVKLAESWAAAGTRLTERFDRAWYSGVLREAFAGRPQLQFFERMAHERTASEFSALDTLMQQYNRAKVSRRHFGGMPKSVDIGSVAWLRHQFELRRNHKAIRTAMEGAGEAIQAIKPVFMMSPLSVSMYLPPDGPKFDLVIFDEASQVKPEDAFGAIIRARQAIVVGDSRQMPPTSFFDKVTGFEEDFDEDAIGLETNVTKDMESILALMGSKVGERRRWLRWHYRSKHDSLIQPSNHLFYEDRLVVFPNPVREGDLSGVVLHYLPDTAYSRGGSRKNVLEARAVAEAVRQHVHANRELSLGVAAFSQAQQQALEDEIDLLRKGDNSFDEFDKAHPFETLFVKNLENVQGDERDVIFISVGYGKDENGNVWMNFGPLNQEGGERRLNVLITRARVRCEVFTNLRSGDIRDSGSGSLGVNAFREYLRFAETGKLGVPQAAGRAEDSPFESEVLAFLRRSGFDADPQIGSAGFYVDIGVRDPQQPGRYALGVECDGAMYHSARSARDRDKLREAILRSRGWNLHRIWSTDWFRNREREERRLVEAVSRALEGAAQPPPVAPPPFPPAVQRDGSSSSGAPPLAAPPYVVCKLDLNMNGLQIQDVDPRWTAELVAQVVSVEGPVHVEEVYRRIREAAGASRAGARIRAHLESAIFLAGRLRGIERRGTFLYPQGCQDFPVRNRTGLPAASRKLDLVCDEEIASALSAVVREGFGVAEEEACLVAARRLGFEKVTAPMAARMRGVLGGQLGQGSLKLDGGLVKVPS